MDRYYKNDYTANKRTSRNHDLYKSIYEDQQYTNIEGIADIDKSNEVDISKIKDLLKSREDYQSGRELKRFIPSQETQPKYETFERDDDRVYDIRDILTKAKSEKEEEKYHNLDEANINRLKELKNKTVKKNENEGLEDMIDTITSTSKLNKLSDKELGLNMLDDLKSDNTVTSSNESIKAILEEAKKQEQEKTNTSTNTVLDNSFFTSSLSFTNDDFEQLDGMKKKSKGNNVLKIILFIVMLVIAAAIVFLVFNVLK